MDKFLSANVSSWNKLNELNAVFPDRYGPKITNWSALSVYISDIYPKSLPMWLW